MPDTAEPVFFEDLAVGQTRRSGPLVVTREEALAFARAYDPQPFHLDEAAALASPFQGLAISGWHTAALVMRLFVEMRPYGSHPILGLGVDELRWLQPVRPGDALSLAAEVIELAPSRSRPERGTVRMRLVATNQRGEPVFSILPIMLVPRRAGAASAPAAPPPPAGQD
jgi:acyl dehydratase